MTDDARLFDVPAIEPAPAEERAPVDLRRVACPVCGALTGRPCKRPSGHAVFGGDVHAPRRRAAEALR